MCIRDSGQAKFLQGLQRGGGLVDGRLPERLHFGVQLLTDMTGFAPAVAKLVQQAAKAFPVVVKRGAAVSYTHLDVYKRQAQASTLIHGHTHRPADHWLDAFATPPLRRLVLSDWDATAPLRRLEVLRLQWEQPVARINLANASGT